jgi:hypothetical protein
MLAFGNVQTVHTNTALAGRTRCSEWPACRVSLCELVGCMLQVHDTHRGSDLILDPCYEY